MDIVFMVYFGELLSIGANAAAALPLMTALTLLVGRRNHARFCSHSATELARLGLMLSWCGPLLCVMATARFYLAGGELAAHVPLFHPALLSLTLTGLILLAAFGCALLLFWACAHARLPQTAQNPENDKLPIAAIRGRLLLCLLCMAFFLAGFISSNWPYASLPAGMNTSQAATVVVSAALHNYFKAFAPAGAVALLWLLRMRSKKQHGFDDDMFNPAARWCALWAAAGYIPFCLDRWAALMGFSLRGSLPQHQALQILPLAALTGAIICWILLVSKAQPLRMRGLIYAGFALLILYHGFSVAAAITLRTL